MHVVHIVQGNTYEFFENVEIFNDYYEVEVTAISSGGNNSHFAFPRLHDVLTGKVHLELELS